MDAEKYIQARLEFIRRNSTYGLNLEKHADWLDYKKKISAILNDEPLEITYDPPIVEVQVSEEEWRKIQKEARND